MTKVKESSTQNLNKQISEMICPITYAMNKVSGHWKSIILFHLMDGPKRYSALKRAIPAVTEKMLVQHLKELQKDNLIIRKSIAAPPTSVYNLTQSGVELAPILMSLANWAMKDNKQYADF
jgi:DNA-binding HxlR family transcriptional regulator